MNDDDGTALDLESIQEFPLWPNGHAYAADGWCVLCGVCETDWDIDECDEPAHGQQS